MNRFWLFTIILMFSLLHSASINPSKIFASNLLPNVSLKMEDPYFWIKKIKNPHLILLTPDQINKMNEENLKRGDLYLYDVKTMKEDWSKVEIINLLKEDWEGFGRTEEVRYGRNGKALDDSFWSRLKENFNEKGLRENNHILFAFTVRRTDIRVFPTDEVSMITPNNFEFDRFQHSAIPPGVLIGIYHFSRDNLWAYTQTPFIRGWIRTEDIAIAGNKNEAIDFINFDEKLVVTGNFIKVYADPFFKKKAFHTQMGSTFPLISFPEKRKKQISKYVIRIPLRKGNGELTMREGYIREFEDVHRGFLPYTQQNIALQAFKMLHSPYGWGEMFGGRDCSRFIMDIFNTFGILMPRNSALQSKIGLSLGSFEGETREGKKKVLEIANPFATLLRMPGHIMLYLGKHNERYYVIHSIWGTQIGGGWFDPVIEKIGKVVVSDLELGSKGPYGSLLDRITDIQFIGPNCFKGSFNQR